MRDLEPWSGGPAHHSRVRFALTCGRWLSVRWIEKGGRRVVDRENEGTVTRDHASNISRRRLLSILGMGGSALGLATVPLARRGFAQPSKATLRYWASGAMR